jgi:hypothetical protein
MYPWIISLFLKYCTMYFLLFLLHFYYIFYGPKPFIARPHFCVCPKPGPAFPTSYIVALFLWVQWVKMRGFCSCFWKTKHRNKSYTKKCSFKKCATCYQCTFRIVLDVVPGLFHLKFFYFIMFQYSTNSHNFFLFPIENVCIG